MEQDKAAKVQQQNQQQDNLALLSQIATATQNDTSNSQLLKILCEDDAKVVDKKCNGKTDEKTSDSIESGIYLNKLARRQHLLEKQQLNLQMQQSKQQTNKPKNLKKSRINGYNSKKDDDISQESSSEEDLKPVPRSKTKKGRVKSNDSEEGNDTNSERESDCGSEADNDDDSDEDDEDVLDEIDVEYEKLQPGGAIRKENICAICEMPGFLIDCQGSCLQSFHLDCIGLIQEPKEAFKCEECISGHHTCFLCKKPSTNLNTTRKCSSSTCGKYYHDDCIRSNDLFRKENNKSFLCPLHTCVTCWAESHQYSTGSVTNNSQSPSVEGNNNSSNANRNVSIKGNSLSNAAASKGRFMKCARCPTAYHNGDYCLAAGSIALAGCNIICPDHFQPVRGQSQHNRVNVTWCFVCCKGGDLLGCDSCPAAYHYSCLDNPPAPPSITQQWTCEDCEKGKRPLYGEIVWVKVGVYRWWPAQICHPRNLPKNIRERPHQVGEFPVRFFGTNDYFWVTRGRCFSFAEGDECSRHRSNQRGLALAFEKGVHHAKVTFKHVQKLKMERIHKTSGRDALKCAKYNFQFIKTSKPVGNVMIHKVPLSDLPRCDCDPKSQNPCGTDDCLNRILKYECHPAVCPAGERCQNQRFVKRQYPRQEPIYTGSRGWGLRSLIDIKKGEFVNEYVGELIDDEECKRRLESYHENDISNFYFLTITKDRIIDAGPKGNLSRFMNHSCEPNLETQKWNVNGDIRVGLFATCDIPALTELTFNYNLDCLGNEKAVCKCGAKNCSGFIGLRPKNCNNNGNLSSNGKNRESIGRPRKKRKLNDIQNQKESNSTEIINNKIASIRKQQSEVNAELSKKSVDENDQINECKVEGTIKNEDFTINNEIKTDIKNEARDL